MNHQPNVPDDPEAETVALSLAIHYPSVRRELRELSPSLFHNPLKRRIRGIVVDLGRDDETEVPRESVLGFWPCGEFAPEAGQLLFDSIYQQIPIESHWPHYRRRLKDAMNERAALIALEHLWSEIVSPGDCNGHVAVALKEVTDAVANLGPEEQGANLLVPLTAADWNEEDAGAVEFGYPEGEALIRKGDLVRVDAYVGTGKSYFTTAAVIAKSLGVPLLGFPSPSQERAAYIGTEREGKAIHAGRAIRLLRGFGSTEKELDGPWLRVFSPAGLNLDDVQQFDHLRRVLDSFDPALLGVASYNTICGPHRKRNDEAEAADFFQTRLRPLHDRPDGTRRTLCVEGHLRKLADTRGANKGMNDPLQRVSGSHYGTGGADAVIVLEGRGPERFFACPAKRSRSGMTFTPFLCHITGKPPADPIILVNEGGPKKATVDLGNAENQFLEAMAALTLLEPRGGWIKVRQVCKHLGVEWKDSKLYKTIQRAGKSLVARDRLEAHLEIAGCYRLPADDGTTELDGELFGGGE